MAFRSSVDVEGSTSMDVLRKRISLDFEQRVAHGRAGLVKLRARIGYVPQAETKEIIDSAFSGHFLWASSSEWRPWRHEDFFRMLYCTEVFTQLKAMLRAIGTMMMHASELQPAHKNGGWTLWITNYLRPFSKNAPVTSAESLNERVRNAVRKNEMGYVRRNPNRGLSESQIRDKFQRMDRERANRVNTKHLANLLDLLPVSILDILWLRKSNTPAMGWLRRDLETMSSYVIDRYKMRTYLALSNVLRFLHAQHTPLIACMEISVARRILALVNERAEDIPLLQERVHSGEVIRKQLLELAEVATSQPLYVVYDELTRIRASMVLGPRPKKKTVPNQIATTASSSAAAAAASASSSTVAAKHAEAAVGSDDDDDGSIDGEVVDFGEEMDGDEKKGEEKEEDDDDDEDDDDEDDDEEDVVVARPKTSRRKAVATTRRPAAKKKAKPQKKKAKTASVAAAAAAAATPSTRPVRSTRTKAPASLCDTKGSDDENGEDDEDDASDDDHDAEAEEDANDSDEYDDDAHRGKRKRR